MIDDGRLPEGRHQVGWEDVERVFVKNAPFATERAVIFDALRLHFQLMTSLFPDGGELWINGGFTTHKTWAAPKDADLAYLVPCEAINGLRQEQLVTVASLLTLQGVSAVQPHWRFVDRVQPMGGLIDAFFVPSDVPSAVETWDNTWSMVTGPDRKIIPGKRKGYLEVTW
ncbi:hypothetical protein ABJI51_21270 [Amycolatopsis sp. NEAU-NG30]|uniref:Nucleotidyl transferase AbiEii toxin, Type IV TA system n=1 Tax=Amycolatopsis melonis TaxID=3156488 RepID=A0ABV0LJG6_9PSEU